MKITLVISIFLISTVLSVQTRADDWICKEASSVRSGQLVLSCGVGSDKDLDHARKISRDNAIEEFEKICLKSSDCKDFDYKVIPKRSDCELKNSKYTCYRAIEFEILEVKKSDTVIDLKVVERQLAQRQQEVNDLQSKIQKINELKDLESRKQELRVAENELSVKEGDQVKLEQISNPEKAQNQLYKYTHELFSNSLKFSYKFQGVKMVDSGDSNSAVVLSYENRPSKNLGVEYFLSVGGSSRGIKSIEDIELTQSPNDNKVIDGRTNYTQSGVGLVWYLNWSGAYLKAQGGYLSAHKSYYDVLYNGAGFRSVVTTQDANISGIIFGSFIGFDNRHDKDSFGWSFETGLESFPKTSSIGLAVSFSLNLGF